MTGLLKTNGSIENQGEAKFTHPDYCPDVEDTAQNIGCAFKASRGHFNQMNVNEIYLPATTTTSYEGNKISFKTYSGGNNGTYTNVSEVAQINTAGLKVNGYIQTIAENKAGDFATIGDNGQIYKRTPAQVLSDIGAAASNHIQAYTSSECTTYTSDDATIGITPAAVKKAFTIFEPKSHNHDSNYLKLSGGTMSGAINGVTTSTVWINMSHEGAFRMPTAATNKGAAAALSIKTHTGSWGIGGLAGKDNLYFVYGSDANYNAGNNAVNASVYISAAGGIYGAVWNDYAEFRKGNTVEAGRCVIEVGDDTLITSTERMMPGANITSDTFGFAIGETEQAKTPIAVSGRVLAYPYESREEFKKNIGRPVCSGPNGTVSIMTDEEYRNKGYCAIGTISAVPDYEEWGTGKVKVNGRVWIKVF